MRCCFKCSSSKKFYCIKSLPRYIKYHRFVDRLSTILEPLHKLLTKGRSWELDKTQQIAFEKAKQLLTFTQVLSHYDPAKPLIMSCDASPYGIAAV